MSEQKENSSMDILKTYLPLVIAVVGAAITWGVFTQRMAQIEIRVASLELRIEKINDNFNILDKKLTEITTILQERLPVKK